MYGTRRALSSSGIMMWFLLDSSTEQSSDGSLFLRNTNDGTYVNRVILSYDSGENEVIGGYQQLFDNKYTDNSKTIKSGKNSIASGTWHHVAMTWEMDGLFTSYLDGELVDERDAGSEPLPTISSHAYLGAYMGSSEFTSGRLDEVRIWSVARTEEQLVQWKDKSLADGAEGLVAYYKFDEFDGNVLPDSSGNGFHGQLRGANWAVGANPSFTKVGPKGQAVPGVFEVEDAKVDSVKYLADGRTVEIVAYDVGSTANVTINGVRDTGNNEIQANTSFEIKVNAGDVVFETEEPKDPPAPAELPWSVGMDDDGWPAGDGGGANTSFMQEKGSNELPGDPASPEIAQQADDDYYWAGLYSTVIEGNGDYEPVGLVEVNEEAAERAFAGTDNDLRYHFNLPSSLKETDHLSISYDAMNLHTGQADSRYGIEVYFNNVQVQSEIVIREAELGKTFTTDSFTLADVNAEVGSGYDNIITLKGVNYNAEGGGNWMGIDYVLLNVAGGGGDAPTVSVVNNGDGTVTVTFEGKLQAAPTVNGPWQDVDGASPLTIPADQAQQFGRAVRE